jgi:transposase
MLPNNPTIEAGYFMALSKRGAEPIEAIRRQIGTHTPYRRETLLKFDALRIQHRTGELSRELRGEILRLLSEGWTQPAVARQLGICWLRVARVAWAAEASSWRRKGRRLSRAERAGITEAIRNGQRPKEILEKFPVSRTTVHRMRGALGDRKNWRSTRVLTHAQAREIRALMAQRGPRLRDDKGRWTIKSGVTWRQIAAQYGVSYGVVQNICERKHGY